MFNVKTITLLITLLCTACSLIVEDPMAPLARRLLGEKEIRIVFIGDSVTYGVGLISAQKNYIALLKEDLKSLLPDHTLIFINAGRPDENSRTIFDHLEQDVLTYRPHAVVIMLGLNDYLSKRISPYEFDENIQRLIDRLPSHIGIILATGPSLEFDRKNRASRMLNYDIFMAVLRKTAAELSLPLIDVLNEWEKNRDSLRGKVGDLYSDPAHPNEKGHRLIADTFFRSFKKYLRKAKKQ